MSHLTRLFTLLLLVFAAPASAHMALSSVLDETKLPVGDNKYSSTTAKQGSIYTCRANYNGSGAFAKGPWFNSDGTTFDFSKKATVDGRVTWPAAKASFSFRGSKLQITGTGLPVNGFTGMFPVATTDDAYNYDRNPNSVKAQTVSVSLPADPTKASKPTCVRGSVGFALNGVEIFNGLDAGGRDALAWEVQDDCQGHPNQSAYHYHSISTCQTSFKSGKSHGALVGYAYDGFGIYAPRGESGELLENSDLDACHGHSHKIKWRGETKRMYHYHATREYPYTVGCFRGTSSEPQPTGPPAGAP